MIESLNIQEIFFLFTGLGTMVAAAWLYTQRYSHLAILAGIRTWSYSLVLTGIGWLLLSQGRHYPLYAAVIPANLLLMAGFALQIRSYAVLLQRRLSLRFIYAALLLSWLGLTLLGTVYINHPARAVMASLFYALAGFSISAILFTERQAGSSANLRFIGAVYFFLALGMLLRAAVFLGKLAEPQADLYPPGSMNLLLLLISILTSFFPTFAFIGLCNNIYEFRFRKQQIELQRLSEELSMRHRMAAQVLSGISGFIYRCTADERRMLLYVSDTLEEVTGFPVTYFSGESGRSFSHLMHSHDAERIRRLVTRCVAAGEIFSAEYRIVTASGAVRWLRDHGGPVYSAGGVLSHFEGIAIDITSQIERDQQLIASEKRISDLINSVEGIVWEADAATFNFSFVSGHAEYLLGFSPDEWLAPGFWLGRLHSEDKSWAPAFCSSAAERLEAHEFEYRFIAKDGRIVWLRDIVSVVSENGRPRWLRGIMIDVTERRKNEERLGQLNFMYSLLSSCRRMLNEVKNESDLFRRIVELCVAENKISLAWIGIPGELPGEIAVTALAGESAAYLQDLQVSTNAGEPQGRGPTGVAMREGHDVIVNYSTGQPGDFWSERRSRFGLKSYAAVVLSLSDIRTGSLNLYSGTEGFFTPEIIDLFDQLAVDISAALDRLEVERWRAFAEQNIRENQLLLDFALESTIDAVWDMDLRSGTVRFFRHWEKMLGYAKGELNNDLDTWQALVHPEDLSSSVAAQQRYINGEIAALENSLRVRGKSGDYFWIKNRGLIVERDEGGVPLRLVGTLKNIDQEVRRAEEARRNAILLDAVFDASPVGIAILDGRRRLVRANPAVEKLVGIKTDKELSEALNKLIFYYPDGRRYATGTIPPPLELAEPRQAYSDVFGFKAKEQDDIRWISMSTNYLSSLDLVVRISTDITPVKETESALRESEIKFRMLFEALPVAVSLHRISDRSLIDGNHRVVEYSEMSLEQLKRGEFRAREYFDSDRRPLPFSEFPSVRALAENRIIENTIVGYEDGKTTRWFDMSVVPMAEIGIFASILKEVTTEIEQRQALARLAADLEQRVKTRTHELEEINAELEAFSYSLSHDLKAPLTRAQSWLNILLHEFHSQLEDKGAGFVAYAASEIAAMERMTQAMLSLARAAQTELHLGETNLSLLAEEILEQLRLENPDMRVEAVIAPDVVARADAELMRLLLRNLLENAVKFSRGRNAAAIKFGTRSENGEIVFFVQDNGVGFDMRYADRLFAPFQRLHSQSQFPGTGIGLATAQRVVHRHGGHIWADSEVDKGTGIYFTLAETKK